MKQAPLHTISRQDVSSLVDRVIRKPELFEEFWTKSYSPSQATAMTFPWDLLLPLAEKILAQHTGIPDSQLQDHRAWVRHPTAISVSRAFGMVKDSITYYVSMNRGRLPDTHIHTLKATTPWMHSILSMPTNDILQGLFCAEFFVDVARLLCSCGAYANAMDILNTTNVYPVAFDKWIELTKQAAPGGTISSGRMPHDMIIHAISSAIAGTAKAHGARGLPAHTNFIFRACSSRAQEAMDATLERITKHDDLIHCAPSLPGPLSNASLQTLRVMLRLQVVPEVHRILNQAPFISLACRALRRIAHLNYVREGLPPTEPMGIVNDILTFICDTLYSAENVAEVLQGRAIISLLRIEAAAAKIGGGTYDQGREVNRVSMRILDGLAPFLILDLPSCHRAFERSFRYIDQHMDKGSTAPTGLRVKLEGMRKSRTALSGQLWACSNAECPQRADTSSCESRYWRCAGCGVAEYCSTACQRKDWKDGHAQQCPQIQTAQRERPSHVPPCSRDMQALFMQCKRVLSPTIREMESPQNGSATITEFSFVNGGHLKVAYKTITNVNQFNAASKVRLVSGDSKAMFVLGIPGQNVRMVVDLEDMLKGVYSPSISMLCT